jgi:hypothetical protein
MFATQGLRRTVCRAPALDRVAAVVALVLAALILAPASALAAKPTQVQPFTLQSESIQSSSNSSAPAWCLNEDDFHYRTWSGSLNGSLSTTERLCDYSVDYSGGMYWSAGGIGLEADLYVVGTLSGLTITSPLGVTRSAVLVGSQYLTKQRVTQDHYQVCITPTYSLSSDIGGTPLGGGTWTINLAGNFSQAAYSTTAIMADVTYQQQYCPTSQQAFAP